MTEANLNNKDIVESLRKLCAGAVATIETKLEAQKTSDAAEARRLEQEEAKHKAKEEREKCKEER